MKTGVLMYWIVYWFGKGRVNEGQGGGRVNGGQGGGGKVITYWCKKALPLIFAGVCLNTLVIKSCAVL